MVAKIDHNKAFSSLKPEDKEPTQPEQSQQEGQEDEGQGEYQEPEDEDLMSEEEMSDLEMSLVKDGYSPKDAMALINSHLDELRQMHRTMHDEGKLKDFLEDQDGSQEDGSQEDGSQEDGSQEDGGQTDDQSDSQDDSQQPTEQQGDSQPDKQDDSQPAGGNPELMSHYMKMHEQQQKHLHQMMQSFAGAKK